MNSNVSVPYTKIKSNWMEFVSPDDLPQDVTFNHPSRYRAATTHAILKLWRKQQANGQQPFQFKAILNKEGKLEPAVYPDIFLATSTTFNVKSAKGKGRQLPQDAVESSESEDTYHGDESVSISDSNSYQSERSNDGIHLETVTILLPESDKLNIRDPIQPVSAKLPHKVQPVVTIITKPKNNPRPKATANEQLATPIGSEPPEESTVGGMRSLRVTTLEHRARQMTNIIDQKLQKEKQGQPSLRKSPRKK